MAADNVTTPFRIALRDKAPVGTSGSYYRAMVSGRSLKLVTNPIFVKLGAVD